MKKNKIFINILLVALFVWAIYNIVLNSIQLHYNVQSYNFYIETDSGLNLSNLISNIVIETIDISFAVFFMVGSLLSVYFLNFHRVKLMTAIQQSWDTQEANDKAPRLHNRVRNVFLLVIALLSLLSMCLLSALLSQLVSSPDLYIKTQENAFYSDGFVIVLWKNLCISALVFSISSFILSAFSIIYVNFFYNNSHREEIKIMKKQKRLEELQAELDELKKE